MRQRFSPRSCCRVGRNGTDIIDETIRPAYATGGGPAVRRATREPPLQTVIASATILRDIVRGHYQTQGAFAWAIVRPSTSSISSPAPSGLPWQAGFSRW